MSKKVLILSGSPRRGGNSEKLCQQFASGAVQASHSVEMIRVADHTIQYCTGCCSCQRSGKCPMDDEAGSIVKKLLVCDVIVLATPVYFYSMSGQLKTLIDRSIMVYPQVRNKEFYFIMTMADTEKENFKGTLEALHGFVQCCENSKVCGVIAAAGVYEKGEIQSHEAMQQAFDAGAAL